MRGDQLSRQWCILRAIESKKQGTTVAELASQEDCSPCTIWRDLAAIQEAGFPLSCEKDGHKDSHYLNTQGPVSYGQKWGFLLSAMSYDQ